MARAFGERTNQEPMGYHPNTDIAANDAPGNSREMYEAQRTIKLGVTPTR